MHAGFIGTQRTDLDQRTHDRAALNMLIGSIVDRQWQVLRVVTALAPWRASYARGAALTLELAPGAAATLGIAVGHRLAWRPAVTR
jgi:uncharacterized membrane protein (UPF0127 family)